jgi:hypothetical protein
LLGYRRENDGDPDKNEMDRKTKREEGQKEGYTNTKVIIDMKELAIFYIIFDDS